MKKQINTFFSIFIKFTTIIVFLGFILRIILMLNNQTIDANFTAVHYIKIFLFGIINDICMSVIGFAFIFLFLISLSRKKFAKPTGYIILATFIIILSYLFFFNNMVNEFGSGFSRVVKIVLCCWTGAFAIRVFFPKVQKTWSIAGFATLMSISVFIIFFNTVSEYFFWNEFGVRYNFIAVDYLIYTNEVVGNIMESYPMIPLIGSVIAITLIAVWILFRKNAMQIENLKNMRWKLFIIPAYLIFFVLSISVLSFTKRFQNSGNTYCNELQANGVYKFYEAFNSNNLDYDDFYTTIPEQEANKIANRNCSNTNECVYEINSNGEEKHPNIVLITIESCSADFMRHFGNSKKITPNLDSLYDKGIAFYNMFATGNRTVRGLEAVTLCLPPSPGQSRMKRDTNARKYSTGSILKEKGYEPMFFYGGASYFDNMGNFFSNNGYAVISENDYAPDEITFENIWGVCDEDAYNKTIKTINERFTKTDRPFFAHIMTISNHRPFTYPAGRISIPNNSKSRDGGVMYSDYALGKFINDAKKQKWFENTVFVITADHCASSAGKISIPLEKYHIPALIYAPAIFAPDKINKVTSQIDLMPTLFALLNMSYKTDFYGENVLSDSYKERAFVATYQNLGFLENNILTILSPERKNKQFKMVPNAKNPYNLKKLGKIDSASLLKAVSFYQTSANIKMENISGK